MNDLRLKTVCKEIFDRAENGLVLEGGLPKLVDDYFIERVKADELAYAAIDPTRYEALRGQFKKEVLPLYEAYYQIRDRILERKQARRPTFYILGAIGALQVIDLVLTKGKSLLPQILIPTALAQGFIGFVIYALIQYKDDFILRRARRRLEHSLLGLDQRMDTELSYEERRRLMDADVLKGDAVAIVSQYEDPKQFWADYLRVRQTDPTTPSTLAEVCAPAFAQFLRSHLDGTCSAEARQTRFNHLFLLAQELFVAKDRRNYVIEHLQRRPPTKT